MTNFILIDIWHYSHQCQPANNWSSKPIHIYNRENRHPKQINECIAQHNGSQIAPSLSANRNIYRRKHWRWSKRKQQKWSEVPGRNTDVINECVLDRDHVGNCDFCDRVISSVQPTRAREPTLFSCVCVVFACLSYTAMSQCRTAVARPPKSASTRLPISV